MKPKTKKLIKELIKVIVYAVLGYFSNGVVN